MIINEENKFIFIHVYRTGGSSIDRAFGGNTKGLSTHTKLETIPNWEKYFSFAFIRNPWDRMVSSYMYLTARGQYRGTFEEYVQQFAEGELRTSKQFAQHNMVRNCSYVGRFEHLQTDFDEVCNLIGIPMKGLPHVWKTKHKPYQEMYNDELRTIVGDALSGDIEMYGFNFDSTATRNIGDRRQ